MAGLAARGAWLAGRRLYRSLFSTVPSMSYSGTRLTKQFSKPGGYRTALKDFARFEPRNIKRIDGDVRI